MFTPCPPSAPVVPGSTRGDAASSPRSSVSGDRDADFVDLAHAEEDGTYADPFVGCGLRGVRALKSVSRRHTHEVLESVFG